MEAKQLFSRCLQQATDTVMQVKPEDFTNPTPNTKWNVRDLAGHMLYELSWAADILQGKTIAEVGDKYEGDLIGDDLQANWQAAYEKAVAAMDEAALNDSVHLSYGDTPAQDYLWQVGGDLLIHAWDLGEGIDQPVRFEKALAQAVYANRLSDKESMADSGLFAAPVKVPDGADMQAKLLALTGRHPATHIHA